MALAAVCQLKILRSSQVLEHTLHGLLVGVSRVLKELGECQYSVAGVGPSCNSCIHQASYSLSVWGLLHLHCLSGLDGELPWEYATPGTIGVM